MRRARIALWWALPAALFVWLYWQSMRVWFHQDDFAWLGLGLEIHSVRDWLQAVFEPRAQGTIRPWSERLFFLVFSSVFGLDHRPFHLWVALTQVCNLALLQSIVWRLTRSRLAGVAAPLVWLCGVGLAMPLSWLSTYNQVLCAFFLLLAFRLLLSGRWGWQVAVFLLGFGALEINIVYPALAAAYCLMFDRKNLRKALWLFPVSALYAVIHFRVAPNPTEGPYAQHWDLSVLHSYIAYWGNALAGGMIVPEWKSVSPRAWETVAWCLGALLVTFVVWAWRRGERLPVFGVVWFTVVIAPILPLRDHFSEYYLAVPSIGLALVVAVAVREAWRAGWGWRAAMTIPLAAHLAFCLPVNRQITNWRFERGYSVRVLVQGMERAHELHPGKLIILVGMDTDLFWGGFYDQPNRLFGAREVCLAPGEEEKIEAHPDLGEIDPFACSQGVAARALADGRAVVYRFEATALRNVTRQYVKQVTAEWFQVRPRHVNAGLPMYERDLGEGWFSSEGNQRWMGRRAEVRLSGPAKAGEKLAVAGACPYCGPATPNRLVVSAEGAKLGEVAITGTSFDVSFELPRSLEGRSEMKVLLEVDRTVTAPNDIRALGLAFGQIGLR